MLQLVLLIATAVLIAVDQLTKWLAVTYLKGADPIVVIDRIFSFTYTENTGAAWNMFAGQRWLLVGVTAVMLIGMLIVLLSGRFRAHKMAMAGGVLVVAGGLGNLIDRMWRGYVVDFLKTEFIDFPIFNGADCFVVIGALLLFVYFVFIYSDSSEKTEGKKEAVTSGDADDHDIAGDGGTTA